MNKILLFGTALLMATSVLAFGGGGKSRKSSVYRGVGVDSVDVHINGKGGACAAGVLEDRFGKCTVCANGNVYLSYKEDPCGTETIFDGCKSNEDCNEGEYCNLDGSNCEQPNTGTCTAIGDVLGPVNIEGLGEVINKYERMSWWSADNWCKAQGKSLIDVAEFNCYQSDTSTLVTGGSGIYSSCCVSGQSAGPWYNYWENCYQCENKTILPEHEDFVYSHYSAVIIALRQNFGPVSFWTSSNYSADNSCAMFNVSANNSDVGNFSRPKSNGPFITPLCR